MKLRIKKLFFIFFLFMQMSAKVQSSQDFIKKAQEIIQKTKFAPYVDSIVRARCIKFNLFFMHDEMQKYVIKIMRNNPFLLVREKFCSDFAQRAGFDDAIVPVEIYGDNKLIIGQYCYFNPFLKTAAVSLGDALDYAKEKERIIPDAYIQSWRKDLWTYDAETKEYDLHALDHLNFEKALVFSFIMLLWDLHRANVLLQISSENPLIIKIKLIDFSNSMTENKQVAGMLWPGRVVHPCCLLNERLFKKYLEKKPSDEIKKIVNHLKKINFDDLFDLFEREHKEIDRSDFYKRITDVIDAFNNNQEKSIGEIMEELFLSRYPFNL